MMTRLIPKIFYHLMTDALDLFVSGLGFDVLHQDGTLAVVGRDGAKAYLVESAEFAAKDRPEISTPRPDLLHPNLSSVKSQSWGSREFAIKDKTDVCVVLRQW